MGADETVLVTGGAGFIGSHTVLDLINAGYHVVVIDNLVNASEESLRRVGKITQQPDKITFEKVDLLDRAGLAKVFKTYKFDSCIHFAGAKAVGESMQDPLKYYDNNVAGTVNLLKHMRDNGCKKLVVSSSATVYGTTKEMPLTEDAELGATNPYGRSKHIIEQMLHDLYKSDPEWNVIMLRYFNPCGAHQSGLIGEDPRGVPNNLMPILTQVAVGRREVVSVFGDNYNTPDGSPIRDYVHVMDISRGHVAALQKLNAKQGCVAVNLGTGKGTSVLELIEVMEEATGIDLPYRILPRRAGDAAVSFTNPAFAKEYLGWEAKLTISDMCSDSWRWQSRYPNGYNDSEAQWA